MSCIKNILTVPMLEIVNLIYSMVSPCLKNLYPTVAARARVAPMELANKTRNVRLKMLAFMRSNKQPDTSKSIAEELFRIYKEAIYPLEQRHGCDFLLKLEKPDFTSLPMIVVVGQRSVGKTAFVRWMLGCDYPGMTIAAGPVAERSVVLAYGSSTRTEPGLSLLHNSDFSFQSFDCLGRQFGDHFECSYMDHDLLKHVTLVDTTGFCGSQRIDSAPKCDRVKVLRMLIGKADAVIVVFDVHNLDISDDLAMCVQGYEDKLRIVLNKSDKVSQQNLLRIYGALMLSLRAIIHSVEAPRIFVLSFFPLTSQNCLIADEQLDFLKNLQELVRDTNLRHLDNLVKRAKLVKVFVVIMCEIERDQKFLFLFKKRQTKTQMLDNLTNVLRRVRFRHGLSEHELPNQNFLAPILRDVDLDNLRPLNRKLVANLEKALREDIAVILEKISKNFSFHNGTAAFDDVTNDVKNTPFAPGAFKGYDYGRDESVWVVCEDDDYNCWKLTFRRLSTAPACVGVSKGNVATHFRASKLPDSVLERVWTLADVDEDGKLSEDEFSLACYIIKLRLAGFALPNVLPTHLDPRAFK